MVVDNQSLSSITLWNYCNWCWPSGPTVAYDFCCKEFLNFVFHPLIILHSNQVCFWDTSLRGAHVNGHLCDGSCSYGCLIFGKLRSNILSWVHQILDSMLGFSLWQGGMESVWLNLFCHQFLKSDTICWVIICLTFGRYIISHAIFYGGFKASYVFSFVEFNVFVLLYTKTLIDVFSFDAVDAIDDVNIRVPAFCQVLISNKVSNMFLNCLTCDPNWYNTIVSR